MIDLVLACILAWLILSLFAVPTARTRLGTFVVYADSLLVAVVLLVTGATAIPAGVSHATLPVGREANQ
jgi:hypothetical protein